MKLTKPLFYFICVWSFIETPRPFRVSVEVLWIFLWRQSFFVVSSLNFEMLTIALLSFHNMQENLIDKHC